MKRTKRRRSETAAGAPLAVTGRLDLRLQGAHGRIQRFPDGLFDTGVVGVFEQQFVFVHPVRLRLDRAYVVGRTLCCELEDESTAHEEPRAPLHRAAEPFHLLHHVRRHAADPAENLLDRVDGHVVGP